MSSRLDRQAFVARYGGVYEHSPWVAEACWERHAQSGPADLADPFRACVDSADRDRKLALIRAHPDLAGRAAVRGELTTDSGIEQSRAGIDQCSPQEYDAFRRLNAAYREKFGFPFVMAVRNSSREEILEAFARRLQNDPETEFARAIDEIHKIARLRLEAMA